MFAKVQRPKAGVAYTVQVNELEIDLRKQTDLLYHQTWQNDI